MGGYIPTGYYYHICRGVDHRPVQPIRTTKSVSAERTFDENLLHLDDVLNEIARIAKISFQRYAKSKAAHGHTLTLKLKHADFTQITRNKTMMESIEEEDTYVSIAMSLMQEKLIPENGIRLIGVGISNFKEVEQPSEITQLTLNF